jgi:hypothetical protein
MVEFVLVFMAMCVFGWLVSIFDPKGWRKACEDHKKQIEEDTRRFR